MTQTAPATRLDSIIISPSASISEAISRLNEAGTGALALCSANRKLVGLLTDGDIRRAILKSRNLNDPCGSICSLDPIAAIFPVAPVDALRQMKRHDVNHLPVVDGEGILCDFILRRDLIADVGLGPAPQQRLDSVVISPSVLITEAIAKLDDAGTGALLLCKDDRILCGLLTDGDIRRAVLQGKSMDARCDTIACLEPIFTAYPISAEDALQLMNKHDINHLPLVDNGNRVVEFLLRKDLVIEMRPDLSAVIMAGGFGKRMLPLTESVPKPMLPIGDRPLLELAIKQLRRSGIRDVNLTTHYLSESIVKHFGDGETFGVKLNYMKEDHPMGTAGGLRQMNRPDGPFVVINGDILTGVPFQEMLAYHKKHRAVLTVGVRRYDMQVPFGVVECEDVRITRLEEKPSLGFFINAGTYLLEPSAWDCIPEGRPFDMTDLIQKLLGAGRRVVSFPIIEYWLDVGRHEDYEKAQKDIRNGKLGRP